MDISKLIEYCKEFGVSLTGITAFSRVLRMLHLSYIVPTYDKYKYKIIENWLEKEYGDIISSFEAKANQRKISKDDPIYIFWWQGEKAMPSIVKACYRSIIQNAGEHVVELITEDNVKNFVQIPQGIYDGVKEGKISIAHLSDVIRNGLLYQRGGIWMDATIYMTAPLPEIMYEYEYYTLKGAFEDWKWSTFFQASGRGNVLPGIVSCVFDEYIKEHTLFLTYLLQDCIIQLCYDKRPDVRCLIDKLPWSDKKIFQMNDKYLDEPYTENLFTQIRKESCMHKLSYKYHHEIIKDGKMTVWGKLLREGE